MVITLQRVEDAAPDQASLTAARKLLKPAKWPEFGIDAAEELLWGACQGSGAQPYRMAVAVHDLGAKCTCPSRKFPCKHSLALMWWRATEPERFVLGEVPEWVSDWLSRRRGAARAQTGDEGVDAAPSRSKSKAPQNSKAPRKSILEAESPPSGEPRRPHDPAAAERQRERNRAAREESILAGLDELDQWIADQVDAGFGAFAQRSTEQCRTISRRLADAKASGLATRVDQLAAEFFGAPEPERHELLLRGLGTLHLLAEAYRRQDRLPEDLRSDLRRQVGWSVSREQLLEDATARRARAAWVVLANRRTTRPDRLVRFETFLAAADPGVEPRHAVLVDHLPAAQAGGHPMPAEVGGQFDAELVFHPSSVPWRALIAEQSGLRPDAGEVPVADTGLDGAFANLQARAARLPWWGKLPLAARGRVRRAADDGSLWWTDGDSSLPIDPACQEVCEPLVGLGRIDLHGCFDGRRFLPMAARTAWGPWWNETL